MEAKYGKPPKQKPFGILGKTALLKLGHVSARCRRSKGEKE